MHKFCDCYNNWRHSSVRINKLQFFRLAAFYLVQPMPSRADPFEDRHQRGWNGVLQAEKQRHLVSCKNSCQKNGNVWNLWSSCEKNKARNPQDPLRHGCGGLVCSAVWHYSETCGTRTETRQAHILFARIHFSFEIWEDFLQITHQIWRKDYD